MSALLQRADELTLTTRQRVPGADAGFEAFQREVALGGGLLAGGLAYRLFLWLLPIEPAIASAAKAVEASQSNRILLLITGLVLLAWFSLGFVRAPQLAYALVWAYRGRSCASRSTP